MGLGVVAGEDRVHRRSPLRDLLYALPCRGIYEIEQRLIDTSDRGPHGAKLRIPRFVIAEQVVGVDDRAIGALVLADRTWTALAIAAVAVVAWWLERRSRRGRPSEDQADGSFDQLASTAARVRTP